MTLHEIVTTLHDWQELAGAIIGAGIGAVMGTVGALIVSRGGERREVRSAARLLILDLMAFETAHRTLQKARKEQEIDDRVYPDWLAAMLIRFHYRVSGVFASQLVTVVHLDNVLGADLKDFYDISNQIHEDVEAIAIGRSVPASLMPGTLTPAQRVELLPGKLDGTHVLAVRAIETLNRFA